MLHRFWQQRILMLPPSWKVCDRVYRHTNALSPPSKQKMPCSAPYSHQMVSMSWVMLQEVSWLRGAEMPIFPLLWMHSRAYRQSILQSMRGWSNVCSVNGRQFGRITVFQRERLSENMSLSILVLCDEYLSMWFSHEECWVVHMMRSSSTIMMLWTTNGSSYDCSFLTQRQDGISP